MDTRLSDYLPHSKFFKHFILFLFNMSKPGSVLHRQAEVGRGCRTFFIVWAGLGNIYAPPRTLIDGINLSDRYVYLFDRLYYIAIKPIHKGKFILKIFTTLVKVILLAYFEILFKEPRPSL